LALATTAPDASVTAPVIDDVLTCAETKGTSKTTKTKIKTASLLAMEHPSVE